MKITLFPRVHSILGICCFLSGSVMAATFNVKTQYGATGNGSTDDTASINNAIVAANSAAGTNTVYFPAGTYIVNNVTVSAVTDLIFDGDGASVSILKRKPSTSPQQNRIGTITNGNNLTFQEIGVDVCGIERFGGFGAYSTSNLVVQKVRCYDSAPVGPQNGYDRYAFYMSSGCSNVTIQDSVWEDLQIEVDRCQTARILRNVVYRPRETGGIGVWALANGDRADDYLIRDNWVIDPTRSDAGGIVVHLDGPSALSNCSLTNIQILNNTIIYTYPTVGTLRPPAIKCGTTNSAMTGTGNVFNLITVTGNRIYVSPSIGDTFARTFIWFWGTYPTPLYKFDNTTISGNTLYHSGAQNIFSINGGAAGVNWVQTNNVKAAYVTPPPVPNPLVTATATTITTASGAGAEAQVRRGDSLKNFGELGYMSAHNASSASRWNKAWFRFDLGNYNPASITNATVTLTYTGNQGGGTLGSNNAGLPFTFALYGLLDSQAGNNWVEGDGGVDNLPSGEINWNTAPGNFTGNGSGVTAGATYGNGAVLASFTITGAGSPGMQIPLSSAVLTNFLKSDTDRKVTFILVQTSVLTDVTSGADANTFTHSFGTKELGTGKEPSLQLQ